MSGAAEGAGEAPAASCASAAGVAGDAALSGLRSGSPGATLAFWTGVLDLVLTLTGNLAWVGALTVAARTDFAAGKRWVFASASTEGRRATEMSNGKMRALMRFISSIGFPVTTWLRGQDVPRAGEPRRRRHYNLPELNNV